jgi:hypothetical protein
VAVVAVAHEPLGDKATATPAAASFGTQSKSKALFEHKLFSAAFASAEPSAPLSTAPGSCRFALGQERPPDNPTPRV